MLFIWEFKQEMINKKEEAHKETKETSVNENMEELKEKTKVLLTGKLTGSLGSWAEH